MIIAYNCVTTRYAFSANKIFGAVQNLIISEKRKTGLTDTNEDLMLWEGPDQLRYTAAGNPWYLIQQL